MHHALLPALRGARVVEPWCRSYGVGPAARRRGGTLGCAVARARFVLTGILLAMLAWVPTARAEAGAAPLSASEQVARMGTGVNILGYDP